MKKFTEHFVGPYKVKVIISSNVIELELPSTVKIHLVVNISTKVQVTSRRAKKRNATTSGN